MRQSPGRLRLGLAAVATTLAAAVLAPIQPVSAAAGAAAQDVVTESVVVEGDVWSYFDHGTNPGNTWNQPTYDDTNWQTGNAQFGYGDGDETTTINYGPDPQNKYATTYFRKTINITNTHQLVTATANLTYDDGAIIYLNGTQIHHSGNIPDNHTHQTWANQNREETIPLTINTNLFTNGQNTIAVEIHQAWRRSNDISFDLNIELSRNGDPAPPVVNDDHAETEEGFPTSGQFSDNDDANLTYTVETTLDADVGSFAVNPQGSWVFTPAPLFVGTVVIDHTGCDDAGLCTPATLTVDVKLRGDVSVETLIAAGDVWSYFDHGTNPGNTWNQPTYDDTNWQTGNAQFGYGDGDETTTINYGPDPQNKYATTYFRKTINITNTHQLVTATANLTYDDGAIIYLNGTQIHHSGNIPDNHTHQTWANQNREETIPLTINTNLFTNGQNTIAVEIHQAWRRSNDISFDLNIETTRQVLAGPPAPTTVDDRAVTTPGVAVSGSVATNDRANDDGALTWLIEPEDVPAAGQGTIALADDGSFLFTPAPGFSGTTTIRYWACNVNACSRSELSVIVIDDGNQWPAGRPSEHPAVDVPGLDSRPETGQHGVIGLNPGDSSIPDVRVWDMQQIGDFMYVGGEFQQVQQGENGAIIDQAFLARFNIASGNYDTGFTPLLDGNVHALEATPTGKLLVGGEFTAIDGIDKTAAIAVIDPTTGQVDTSFRTSMERPWSSNLANVRELEVVGDLVYIGGNFSHLRDNVTNKRERVYKITRVDAVTGVADLTWRPEVTGSSVYGIGIDQDRGRVMLAGTFTSVGGAAGTAKAVVIDGVTGQVIPDTMPTTAWKAYDIEYANDMVFLANGWNNQVTVHDADTFALLHQYESDGDFQFIEKVGDYIFTGCHCTEDPLYPSARVLDARTGLAVDFGFNIGGNIEGAWTVATDDRGCVWIGGDIRDGGFGEGTVWARGFARFCGDG